MLKIKDNVDLKELEKFNFEYDEDNDYWFYYGFTEPNDQSEVRYYIDDKDRRISVGFDIYLNPYKILDKIYDLIQARISTKRVNMRIITKKEEKEIESIKKQNEFLSKGYRAMNIALDYQRAIVSILRTLDIKEIEIDDKLLYTTEDEIRVHSTINHTTIIKLVEKE